MNITFNAVVHKVYRVGDRWMACAVGQYVYAILRRQPVRTFASFISLDGMSVRSLPICRDELLPYLQEA